MRSPSKPVSGEIDVDDGANAMTIILIRHTVYHTMLEEVVGARLKRAVFSLAYQTLRAL